MKSTGIVRHVDVLDRIVIPKELRKMLDIKPKDLLEISVSQDNLIVLSVCKDKNTNEYIGLTRHLDDLGRIVIPKEICRTLGITNNDSLEIFIDGLNIVLCKYMHSCVFCKEASNNISYKDKRVCKQCVKNLLELIK